MTEIRPISGTEADDFLKLLCEVFDLDFGLARSIFFQEPFFELKRKWALFEDRVMTSILTAVPLEFGWGTAFGIAGVATCKTQRGKGHASKLMQAVLRASEDAGERVAFLFAREPKIYESVGFTTVDRVVRARIDGDSAESAAALTHDEVREAYGKWSMGHPNRLRRDEKRWAYWSWNMRLATAMGGGYVCIEGDTIREAVPFERETVEEWPRGTEWFGLDSMARKIGVPMINPQPELFLMARGTREPPELFMTDQF